MIHPPLFDASCTQHETLPHAASPQEEPSLIEVEVNLSLRASSGTSSSLLRAIFPKNMKVETKQQRGCLCNVSNSFFTKCSGKLALNCSQHATKAAQTRCNPSLVDSQTGNKYQYHVIALGMICLAQLHHN